MPTKKLRHGKVAAPGKSKPFRRTPHPKSTLKANNKGNLPNRESNKSTSLS